MLITEYVLPKSQKKPRTAKVDNKEDIYKIDFILELAEGATEYKISPNLANQKVLWIVKDGCTRPIAFIEDDDWRLKQ